MWNYNNWAAPSQGGPILLAAVLAVLVAVLIVILIGVLVAVLIVILIGVLVAVLVVVLVLILVIHSFFLRNLYLRPCRYGSIPNSSGFILCFEKDAGDQSCQNSGCNSTGGCF